MVSMKKETNNKWRHKPSLKCNRVYCSYKFLKRGAEGRLKVSMGGLKNIGEASAPLTPHLPTPLITGLIAT